MLWALKPSVCISKENYVWAIMLTGEPYSRREIVQKIGCDKSTVARILAKFKETESMNELRILG